ncbi:hypothetical protein D3C84_399860 [compost metagenome]
MIGGAARVLHRAFDLGDDRLQFVEEAVEPAGQLAEFVVLVVGQAAGQVAFAAGDVFEHVRHAENRPGDAARHQPHQQQADDRRHQAQAQFNQGAGGGAFIEFELEGFRRAYQHFLRHVEQYAPGFTAWNRLERRQHLELAVAVQAVGLAAAAEHAQQFSTAGLVHRVQALAELAGVGAVTGEQAHGAQDADAGLAIVELVAGLLADRLQAVEVDVDRQRGDDLAVHHQREHDAGHQHVLAIDHIKVRLDHTRLEGGARAGEPGIGRLAARAGAGVGHVAFGQRHRVQLAGGRLRPVQGKAPLVVAPQLILADEQLVLAVQGIGFEHQRQAEQLWVGLQRRLDLSGQVFTQVESIQEALLGLFAQKQHLAREPVTILIGVHELLTNPQRLDFTLGLDACLGGFGEHGHARRLDQLRAVLHAVQRKTHQQGHDAGQAQPGEQRDFPLNGKLSERHGRILIR